MKEIIGTAEYAVERLRELGAKHAQCYAELVTKTEYRLLNGEPAMLRIYDIAAITLKAINEQGRSSVRKAVCLERDAVDTAIDECIMFLGAADPMENGEDDEPGETIAELTQNGSFTAGTPECDVDALLDYAERSRQRKQSIAKVKAKLDDDFVSTYTHISKKSVLVNTNGVHLDQHIGWFVFDNVKIPDLSMDAVALDDFYRPFDQKKANEMPVTSLDEKFVGQVLLMPGGIARIWWQIRFQVNDRSLEWGMPTSSIQWLEDEGKKVLDEKLTFEERLLDPRLAGIDRFSEEGYPTQNVTVVENGVVKDFPLSAVGAKKLGKKVNTAPFSSDYSGLNVFVKPGETSVDDMLKGMKRGLILGGLRGSAGGDCTSVVRGGLLVEDGKVVAKVNCMIAYNFDEVMNNIVAVSRETHFNGERETPWILLDGVHIS